MEQSRRARLFEFAKSSALSITSILGILLLWELAARYSIVDPRLFPPPTEVFIALSDWFASGELVHDIVVSWSRAILGWLLGGLLGTCVGLVSARSPTANAVMTPVFHALRPLPPVAIVPLVIVWFGIGFTGKIFSISFAVFFPVWIASYLAGKDVPKEYIFASKIYSKTRWSTFVDVVLPASTSAIITGLRLGLSFAFVMVYVSEIAGASAGVGYRISVAHLAYRIDLMIAALFVLASLGAVSDWLLSLSTNRLFRWRSLMTARRT